MSIFLLLDRSGIWNVSGNSKTLHNCRVSFHFILFLDVPLAMGLCRAGILKRTACCFANRTILLDTGNAVNNVAR